MEEQHARCRIGFPLRQCQPILETEHRVEAVFSTSEFEGLFAPGGGPLGLLIPRCLDLQPDRVEVFRAELDVEDQFDGRGSLSNGRAEPEQAAVPVGRLL